MRHNELARVGLQRNCFRTYDPSPHPRTFKNVACTHMTKPFKDWSRHHSYFPTKISVEQVISFQGFQDSHPAG